MTDSNDDDRRSRPPRGGSDRGGTGKPRPFRDRDDRGARPARNRDAGPPRRADRPSARPAPQGEDRPRRRREEPAVQAVQAVQEPTEERIAKVIARAGVASRRDAEAMIAEGRVTLNGKVLDSPAVNVTSADTILVDGERLPAKERTRLWIFHKPRGLVTTARDPEGRATVFENLPEDLPRVVAVGRLDINTEGLLLLTNDGGLAKVIAHPDTGWLRRYKVRAHGDVTQADLDRLRDGVTIEGMEYGPIEARLDRVQGDNVWMTLGLREGKNREVKRILEHLGLQVNRLIRLSFGPFQLGDLESGLVEEVKTKVLKDQLGTSLAEQAGVDFESPVREPIAPFGSSRKPEAEAGEERPRRDRDERPHRDRDERQHRDRDERPHRRERPERGPREEEMPARPAPDRNAPRRSVWRAGVDEDAPRKWKTGPRLDPREARAANADRPRQRIGRIEAGEGRKVMVERLVSAPEAQEERPARKPRGAERTRSPERPRRSEDRPAPRGEDRPRRDASRPAPRSEDRPRRRSFDEGRDRTDMAPWGAERGGNRGERSERPRADREDRRPAGREDRRPTGRDDRRPFGSRDDRPGPASGRPGPARGRAGASDDRPGPRDGRPGPRDGRPGPRSGPSGPRKFAGKPGPRPSRDEAGERPRGGRPARPTSGPRSGGKGPKGPPRGRRP